MKYICELCGRIYDEELGDLEHGIAAGTAFDDLPAYYSCPLCGAMKDDFTKVTKQEKIQQKNASDREFWQNAKYSVERQESDR